MITLLLTAFNHVVYFLFFFFLSSLTLSYIKILFNHPNVQKYFSEPVSCQSTSSHYRANPQNSTKLYPAKPISRKCLCLSFAGHRPYKSKTGFECRCPNWHFLGTQCFLFHLLLCNEIVVILTSVFLKELNDV